MSQHIGYKRVSTVGQGTDRQLHYSDVIKRGITIDRFFEDKVSGKSRERPQLEALLAHIRKDDTVHVHSIDRLARNMADLLALVEQINRTGATLVFHKENLTFKSDGEADPMQTLQLQMMGAFAQFERALITERANEGRALAKQRGVKFGRKNILTDKEHKAIIAEHKRGKKVSNIAIDYDVSRATVYRVIEGENGAEEIAEKSHLQHS